MLGRDRESGYGTSQTAHTSKDRNEAALQKRRENEGGWKRRQVAKEWKLESRMCQIGQ